MDSFESYHKCDYLDLLRDFEVKKRTITQDLTDKVTFKIPINLNETFRKMHQIEIRSIVDSKSKYKGKLTWTGDKLRMEAGLTKGLFDEASSRIVDHLRKLMKDPSCHNVNVILMVGGFSESPMLRNAIENGFPNMTIIVPQDAGLAVLKGAVLFGHEPHTIKSRVCKMTYGVETNFDFVKRKHPESKRVTYEGTDYCKDIFRIHVKEGETVNVGEKQTQKEYTVVRSDQTSIDIPIYASEKRDPVYTTELGCMRLGNVSVDMPDTRRGMNRGVLVSMTFSGTEIEVEAVDRDTKVKERVVVNFLG